MGTCATQRLAVAKTLHEQWNVPLNMLSVILDRQEDTLERKAKAEGWIAAFSIAAIRNQLLHVFDMQIAQVKKKVELEPENEELAKQLAAMVKTLEGFAAVEAKLLAVQTKIQLDSGDRSNKKAPSQDEQTETDATDVGSTASEQLSQLIERLS